MEVILALLQALITLTNQHYSSGQVEGRGACDSGPCMNGGQCIDLSYPDGPKLFRCVCQEGFRGLTCNRKYDPCRSEPCQNGGVCTAKGERYHCICPEDYKGKNCTESIKKDRTPCADNPCGPHGVCEVVNDAFICECLAGYSGTKCDKPAKEVKESVAIKTITKKEKIDWAVRGILIALLVFIILVILIMLCICCHCLRVWNRRSELISMRKAKMQSGKDVEPVMGWIEMSNNLCWEIFCCCCRSPRAPSLAEDQRCLTDPDNITGVIVPLKDYKEMCCYGNYRDYGMPRNCIPCPPNQRSEVCYETCISTCPRTTRYTPLRPMPPKPCPRPRSFSHIQPPSGPCLPQYNPPYPTPCPTQRQRPPAQYDYPTSDDHRYEEHYQPYNGRTFEVDDELHMMNGPEHDGYQVDTFIQSPETDPARFRQDRPKASPPPAERGYSYSLPTAERGSSHNMPAPSAGERGSALSTRPPSAQRSSTNNTPGPERHSLPESQLSSQAEGPIDQGQMGVQNELNMSANVKLSRGEIHDKYCEGGAAKRLCSKVPLPVGHTSSGNQKVRRGDLLLTRSSSLGNDLGQNERSSSMTPDFSAACNQSQNRAFTQSAIDSVPYSAGVPGSLLSGPPPIFGPVPFANPSPLQPAPAYAWPPYVHPPYTTPQTVIMYPPQHTQASLSDSQTINQISPTGASHRKFSHDNERRYSRRSSSEPESHHRSRSPTARQRLFNRNNDDKNCPRSESENQNNDARDNERESDGMDNSENENEHDFEDDGYASNSRFSESDAGDRYRDLQSFQSYLAQANKNHKYRVRRQEMDSQRRKKTSPRSSRSYRSGSSQYCGIEQGDARLCRDHEDSSSEDDREEERQQDKNRSGARGKSRGTHNAQRIQDREQRMSGGTNDDLWDPHREHSSDEKTGSSAGQEDTGQPPGPSTVPKKIKGILKKTSSIGQSGATHERLNVVANNKNSNFRSKSNNYDDVDDDGDEALGPLITTTMEVKPLIRLDTNNRSPKRQQIHPTGVVKHCPQSTGKRSSHR